MRPLLLLLLLLVGQTCALSHFQGGVNCKLWWFAIRGRGDAAVLSSPLAMLAVVVAPHILPSIDRESQFFPQWHSWNLSRADLLVDIEAERRIHRVTDGQLF